MCQLCFTIVGVKIGYDEINFRKLPEQILSSIKIERSQKTKKTTKGLMVSSSKRTSWIDRWIQLGRLASWTSPAQPFAKLDQPRIQLGRSPSWINHRFSSAVRRAGPVHTSLGPPSVRGKSN
ncbi:hypothetical protein HID58_048166 [Brassica napus]|uniref:Uncharacterized protein n=1 Tax=Brassica napus TaxID=3708 RepID=A0ABQ8B2E4_BRANA|nr:hypothetical protein HID58_048166 [Brassica napus]